MKPRSLVLDQVRVGRDEREACVDALHEHYAAGRLADDELSDRVHRALTATVQADLAVLVEDLPRGKGQQGKVDRPPNRPFWLTLAAALAAGTAVSVAAVLGAGTAAPPTAAQDWCASTGGTTGPDAACPVVSEVQQQIFSDAGRADQAAQQLQELSDQNPGERLDGLAKRAAVWSERAADASSDSQQVVLTSDGEPAKKLMADLAETAGEAADRAESSVDQALDRLDRP